MDDDDEYDLGEIMETQLHNDEDLDDPNPTQHHNTAALHHNTQHSSLLALPASHFTPRPPLPLIGLNNSGATCYLNSLLQALYMTPEWRHGLYQLNEDDIGWQAWKDVEDSKNGKGSKDHDDQLDDDEQQLQQEAEISEADVNELVSMGFEENKVRLALAKYPSIDQREQAIDHIFTLPTPLPTTPAPSAATTSASAAASPSARPFRRIPCAFRLFFSQLQLYNHSSMPTRLITAAFGWSDANLSVQHDIHELYTRLMEAMEGSLKGVSLLPSQLFSGQLTRTLTCESCGGSRSRLEDFYSLHLPVRSYPTIHHSLASVFATESLTLSCDTCGGRQPTAAGSYISRLPLVLTFSLGRHEYDRLKGVRVKVGDEFAFPLVLDMAAYMADVEDEDKRRREQKAMASWPHKEQNGKHKAKPNTANDDSYAGEYSMLPSTFDPSSASLFDLFAVIVHAGSAHSGHYFAYIRDVVNDGAAVWYKCNDSNIAPMDEQLIASQYGGKKESAYMLMYRHRTPQSVAPQPPAVPDELQEAAVEYNERLEEERRAWDEFRNAIKVSVWLDRAVELRGGLLVEKERDERNEDELGKDKRGAKESNKQTKGGKAGKDKQAAQAGQTEEKSAKQRKQEEEEARKEDQRKARELAVAEDEQQRQEEDRKGKYSFVFDQRLTVEEMYEKVRQRLRWQHEKEGGQLRLNRAERVEENRDETGKRLEASIPHAGIQLRDDERQPQDDDDQPIATQQAKTLNESGLRHGDVLLAWNGHTLCQQPYFTGVKRPKRLRLSVRFIRTAVDDVREFACYVGVDATLSELVSVVRRKAGCDDDVQLYVMTKRALTAVDMTLMPIKLSELDITEHFPIVVEPITSSFPSSSLAHTYFLSQSSRVKLVVRDLISPPGSHANLPSHLTTSAQSSKPLPPTDFILFLDKSTTLATLRQLLLSQLPPNFPPPAHSRLRRMTGNDRVGGVLVDERLTLSAAELDDDDVMVRLEEGRLPLEGKELDLVVSFILEDGIAVGGGSDEGETVLDQQPMMFERRWTIKQCKRHILDSCAMPRKETDFLLYRGDAAGVSKDKLLANEYITLDKLNLHHGDTLFLHVGELPIQGKVTLDVFMYTPSLLYATKPASQSLRQLLHRLEYGEEAKEEEGGVELPALPAVVTVPIEDGSPASTADISTRSSLLAHLVTMDFSSAATLADLKQALYSIAPLSSLPSPAHIRIRTLTKSDELHALLADDNATLKRQGVGNDKRLAVQMLPREEKDVVSSALLLRTTLVVPKQSVTDAKVGDVEMLPAAAWVELLFSERLHPQVADMQRWAARQCGLSDEQQLVVAKWNAADRRWRVLVDESGSGAEREEKVADSVDALKAASSKGGGKQGKAVVVPPSLLTPPYQLRHHDHIAILPLRLFPSLGSVAALVTACLQWPAPVMRSADEGGDGVDERRQARKAHHREEVALTIEY